ncbi:N-(5'-phosphoribosyl)anthranilate isomerase [Acaryochloris thomasi RCC1774]|uniref:N-(5'-phosphoribosyl)anthranilate isomerase n=1 Tax=Acaryochloris thomasi RCC1774 TaxID=1764569 RepID=A0A2W1JPU0_9CYAN|nr:phosphoribosylanthranilate isomerase [Acaryochloris thomasi]PZD75266.1 N-(5'-phosphoribosyl)anthranilate isomerase [Acaryochloris thomasi RCC1774]
MTRPADIRHWPPSLRVKICGITKIDQGVAIAQLGAHALGFICVPQSPRFITADQIYKITHQLPETSTEGLPLARIGVFADATAATIEETVERGQLTGVQLHGSESLTLCQQLRAALPQVELIKAFRIKTADTLKQTEPYQQTVDSLLLDAYTSQALGGTGETWDWSIVSDFSPQCPWFLAGGLTPDNVAQALSQTHPSGIDLSSGLEKSPGDKDLSRVERLFKQPSLRHDGF